MFSTSIMGSGPSSRPEPDLASARRSTIVLPGCNALTEMLMSRPSMAADWVRPHTACLLVV